MKKDYLGFNSPKAKVRLRVAVFVENKGNLLLVHDPVYQGGCWMLPGGGVKFDETIDMGAEREVLEETGINIKITDLIGLREIWEPENDYPQNHKLVRRSFEITLRGIYKSGGINITKNPSNKYDSIARVIDCKWFKISNLKNSFDNVAIYPTELIDLIKQNQLISIPINSIFLKKTDLR
ncbi:NUDIX hydrolase, core domain protein [Candidatus Magnetomorum sp. HK-1]|nr:NUDIX hydrolase, core domain protein [Candidatus Magnetomorum sp. HK-1]